MADKKGKGSGKKDACYHKVKSRYSVWPSAYASGALVKCRKVGAKNWGNKSESFEVQEGGNFVRGKDSQIARSTGAGALTPDAAKQLGPKAEELRKKKAAKTDTPLTRENKTRGFSKNTEPTPKPKGPKLMGEGKYSNSETYVKGTAPVRATYGGKTESFPKETYKKKSKKVEVSEGDKYDNLAKDISRVKLLSNAKPPADPKKTAEKKARLEKKRGMKLDDHPQYKEEVEISEAPYQVYGSPDGKKEKKIGKPVKSRKYADAKASELADFHKKTGGKYRSEYVEEVEQIEEKKKSGDPCWVGYKQVGMKKKGGKMVPNCVPEETEVSEGKKEMLAKMNASREGFMAKDGPNKAAHDAKQRILKKTKEKMTEEIVQSILEKCWAGYEKKGMKTMFGKRYPNCVKKKATRKEEVEQVAELYKGKHGQTEKEYQDSRSDAGKMISGDSKGSGANYSYKAKNTGPNPAGGSKKPQGQARMGKKDRDYLAYRKANLKKDVAEGGSAFEFVKNELIKKHGAAAIVGTPENKAATAKRKAEAEKNKKKPAPDTRTDDQKMSDAMYGKSITNPKGSLGT